MSRQVGRILSKTYTFITKGCFSPLRNGKRSQYTCKVDNIRWINIIRGGGRWEKAGVETGRKGGWREEERKVSREDLPRRRSSPVASTTPLLLPKAFPLTRNDLSSLPRSENTDRGRGRGERDVSFEAKNSEPWGELVRGITRCLGEHRCLHACLYPIFQMNETRGDINDFKDAKPPFVDIY